MALLNLPTALRIKVKHFHQNPWWLPLLADSARGDLLFSSESPKPDPAGQSFSSFFFFLERSSCKSTCVLSFSSFVSAQMSPPWRGFLLPKGAVKGHFVPFSSQQFIALFSLFLSLFFFSSNESALCIRWPRYWSFSFSISPSSDYSELISFRIGCFDLLPGPLRLRFLPSIPSQTPENSYPSSLPAHQLESPDNHLTQPFAYALSILTPLGILLHQLSKITTHICLDVKLPCSKPRLMSFARRSHPVWRQVLLGIPGLQPLLGPQHRPVSHP